MHIKFDHLVIFVEHLDQAVQFFKEQKFHVVYGGSHPMWGTYNALIYIGESYLELIAIEHEHVFKDAALQPYTLHETYAIKGRKNGYTRFALRTDQSAVVANILKGVNFDVYGPDQFSRTTPTGDSIQWQMVHAGVEDRSATLPFIIQCSLPEDVRFKSLRAQNIIAPHLIGEIELSEIHIHEGDLQQLAVFYDAIQIPVNKEDNQLKVQIGETKVVYYSDPTISPKIILKKADNSNEFIFDQTMYTIEQ